MRKQTQICLLRLNFEVMDILLERDMYNPSDLNMRYRVNTFSLPKIKY